MSLCHTRRVSNSLSFPLLLTERFFKSPFDCISVTRNVAFESNSFVRNGFVIYPLHSDNENCDHDSTREMGQPRQRNEHIPLMSELPIIIIGTAKLQVCCFTTCVLSVLRQTIRTPPSYTGCTQSREVLWPQQQPRNASATTKE